MSYGTDQQNAIEQTQHLSIGKILKIYLYGKKSIILSK